MKNRTINVRVMVYNLPEYELLNYAVLRWCDGELWFYGTYDELDRAGAVAREIGNGLVVGTDKEHTLGKIQKVMEFWNDNNSFDTCLGINEILAEKKG